MEELTGFAMKNSLILPSLANKYFNSFRDENDESIYSYEDAFMRHFARQSIKSGRCAALNQYYLPTISDEVFNNISKELNVNGNLCENLEKFFEYTKEHRKIIENEYHSQFDEYRNINGDNKEKYVNDKFNKIENIYKTTKI